MIRRWLQVRKGETLVILTDECCRRQAEALLEQAQQAGAAAELLFVPEGAEQVGAVLEQPPFADAIDRSNTIIGATKNSMLTARKISAATAAGHRYLSLPLSEKGGEPMLTRSFMTMEPQRAAEMAAVLRRKIRKKKSIHVTTPAGTDLTFSIEGRQAGSFTGNFSGGTNVESSCFEVYIPPVEDSACGTLVVDASLGYIGAPERPLKLRFQGGKLIEIENNRDGQRLKDYIASFHDDRLNIAGEFGMGLNTCGRCTGNCYIEDESAYGTFHIGMGRNLTFGGKQDAAGHYDLVCFRPTICFDGEEAYRDGRIVFE